MEPKIVHIEKDVAYLYDEEHAAWTFEEIKKLFDGAPDTAVLHVKASYDSTAYVELHYDRLETEAEAQRRIEEEETRARWDAAQRERIVEKERALYAELKRKYEGGAS